ncbi:MAG: carboxypeptidase-like regulatory domain-containing protein, partial [Planctomycetota bacterium]
MSRRGWWLVLGAAALATVLFVLLRPRESAPDDSIWFAEWRPRVIEGTVVAAPGATVEIYEEAEEGFRDSVTAGPDGGFRITWHPRATTRLDQVFLKARHEPFAATIAPIGKQRTRISMARRVTGKGRLLDVDGRPVAGARIAVAVAHDLEARIVDTGPDGTFSIADLPEGAPLHLLTFGARIRTRLEARFSAGETMTVRAHRGLPVRLRVCDPGGAPVVGAAARLDLPLALRPHAPVASTGRDGTLTLENLSSGRARLLRVEADGYLPAQVVIAPLAPAEVVLWPRREVTFQIHDARRRAGVHGVEFEVELDLGEELDNWLGPKPGNVVRDNQVRRSRNAGEYILGLPTAAVRLRLTAPGHYDEELTLAAGAAGSLVRMVPSPMRRWAVLELRCPDAPEGFPLLVANRSGRWYSLVRLRDGEASLHVPHEEMLQVASPTAMEGHWFARTNVESIRRGGRRSVRIHLSPAVRLTVRTQQPVDGEVTVTDLAHEKVAPPARAKLTGGSAKGIWVRPKRKVRVQVLANANYFPVEGEVVTRTQDFDWVANLLPAAGVRYRVADRSGAPVSFARARLWEPRPGGHMDLRRRPRAARTDADGNLLLQGLRGGDAALELREHGFRILRLAALHLKEGALEEGGDLVLEPAGKVRGRVVDFEGKPLPGVWARVLLPRVRRLAIPSGAELELYDLTARSDGDGATDADGRFEVPDASP